MFKIWTLIGKLKAKKGKEVQTDVDSDNAIGSTFTKQWPEIKHIFQSGNLNQYLSDNVIGYVAEKLDGSNVAVTSKGVISSRRNILLNNPTEEELKKVKFSGVKLHNVAAMFESLREMEKSFHRWLYSGRAEHFWTKGAPILTKIFLVLQYMEKLRSSPSEHFLVIRVCQKWRKCKNSEKPGFSGNCGYISITVRSIFMNFWQKTPLTMNKRWQKKFFQNF